MPAQVPRPRSWRPSSAPYRMQASDEAFVPIELRPTLRHTQAQTREHLQHTDRMPYGPTHDLEEARTELLVDSDAELLCDVEPPVVPAARAPSPEPAPSLALPFPPLPPRALLLHRTLIISGAILVGSVAGVVVGVFLFLW